MITVRELIEQLQVLDGDLVVVLQSDPEGNSYRYCRGADVNVAAVTEEYRSTIEVVEVDEELEDTDIIIRKCIVVFP